MNVCKIYPSSISFHLTTSIIFAVSRQKFEFYFWFFELIIGLKAKTFINFYELAIFLQFATLISLLGALSSK